MKGCLACDLTSGRVALPGGMVAEEHGWVVEHCVGPLGLGTLIVKPRRHVEHVANLSDDEALAMGRVLQQAAQIVGRLTDPDQVYVCLWSHASRRPGHIHYVVQPVHLSTVEEFDAHGPRLQAMMFDKGEFPAAAAVTEFVAEARSHWQASS
ncbi:MAG TPA: hypothetical protein VJ938_06930 [Acidimicrobiia bacterium]|nr:hypothetical protein [Acidimicrobiia bacterium]